MENKLYKIADNLSNMLNINEITPIKQTENFYYKTDTYKEAKNTKWYKTFETKDEAVHYAKLKLESNLRSAESSVKYAKEQLDKFNKFYNI